MKAVFFDLDDTLLWDEKAFTPLFRKHAAKRKIWTESRNI